MLNTCAQLIYSGMLGRESSALIGYLDAVPGVHPITAGENPATWMLEVTGGASITGKSKSASVDFAEYYKVPLLNFKPSQNHLQITTARMLWPKVSAENHPFNPFRLSYP